MPFEFSSRLHLILYDRVKLNITELIFESNGAEGKFIHNVTKDIFTSLGGVSEFTESNFGLNSSDFLTPQLWGLLLSAKLRSMLA